MLRSNLCVKEKKGKKRNWKWNNVNLREHFDLHVCAELFEVFRVEILGCVVLCPKLWNISLKAIYYATKLDD